MLFGPKQRLDIKGMDFLDKHYEERFLAKSSHSFDRHKRRGFRR